MITIQNVLTEYKKLDQSTLPAALQAAEFAFVKENMELYGEDKDIDSYIDAFVQKLNEYTAAAQRKAGNSSSAARSELEKVKEVARQHPSRVMVVRPAPVKAAEKKGRTVPAKQRMAKEKKAQPARAAKVKPRKPKFSEGQRLWWFDNDDSLKVETIRSVAYSSSGEPVYQTAGVLDWKYTEGEILASLKKGGMFLKRPAQPVAKTSVVVNLIKRYAALHEKNNPKEAVRRLLAALQKAIVEGQIRQSNPYAKEVTTIQENLVTMVNVEGTLGVVKIPRVEHYQAIGGSQKVMPCARLVKRFISIQGRESVEEKAERLLQQVQNFLGKHDKAYVPYWEELQEIKRSLSAYLKGSTATPQVSEATLRGLMGIAGLSGLGDCGCAPQSGAVVSSVDFSRASFKTAGFTGRWRELIGDPTEPFKIMFYGAGGSFKSTAAIAFARYLAELNRRVLYVAKEEGLGGTLQEKFARLNAFHPNIYICDRLRPADIEQYGVSVVFIDSVNSLGVAAEELAALYQKYPKLSWVLVFQTTKAGSFRGSQEYQHDVDTVVRFEAGTAQAEKNRFGGSGVVKFA
jgi:hypothetical protein